MGETSFFYCSFVSDVWTLNCFNIVNWYKKLDIIHTIFTPSTSLVISFVFITHSISIISTIMNFIKNNLFPWGLATLVVLLLISIFIIMDLYLQEGLIFLNLIIFIAFEPLHQLLLLSLVYIYGCTLLELSYTKQVGLLFSTSAAYIAVLIARIESTETSDAYKIFFPVLSLMISNIICILTSSYYRVRAANLCNLHFSLKDPGYYLLEKNYGKNKRLF